ncbi:MAG TPA: hypothetical protein VMM79_02970 [Longimicrobiales bacterium]|nr:hypothetical protein [Longimicrobiales bacterium]
MGVDRSRQRPESCALLGEPHGRDHAGRAARSDGIYVGEPGHELALEVDTIVEAPAREEAAFHPAHELLDGAFLLRRLHDGLGIIPDGDERDPAECLEAAEQGAHEGFLVFVRHEPHVDGAAPLQAPREEMHALRVAVDVPDGRCA